MNIQDRLMPRIGEMIEQKQWHDLRDFLAEEPVQDIAELFMDLDQPRRVLLFRLLSRPMATEVFSYLDPHYKDALIGDLSREETRYLLDNLAPDDRTEFLEELPGLAIQRLLNLLSPEELKESRKLLGFPP